MLGVNVPKYFWIVIIIILSGVFYQIFLINESHSNTSSKNVLRLNFFQLSARWDQLRDGERVAIGGFMGRTIFEQGYVLYFTEGHRKVRDGSHGLVILNVTKSCQSQIDNSIGNYALVSGKLDKSQGVLRDVSHAIIRFEREGKLTSVTLC